MGLDFIISISCVIGSIALGLSLAAYNAKVRRETHEYRMALYRRRKQIKNENLRRQLGLTPASKNDEYFPQNLNSNDGELANQ